MGLLTHIALAAGGLPNPGQGTAPPGTSGGIDTIVSWAAWGVFVICLLGILVSAGRLAISHQQGYGGSGQTSGLAWACVACVIAGAASGIVGALT